MNKGYWPANYWPDRYWVENYWPEYPTATGIGGLEVALSAVIMQRRMGGVGRAGTSSRAGRRR